MCSQDGKHDSEENTKEPDKNAHPHSIAYRIAEFCLYAIFVSGDIYEWWGDHRIIALIVAVAALGFLLVIDKGFSSRTIARTLSAAAILAVVVYFIVPATRHPDVEVSGTILPADDADPLNACEELGVSSSGKIKIFLGGNVAMRPDIGKSAILTRRGTPLVTVERTADGIYIDAAVFDAAGKLVGTVTKNKFTVLTGDNSYIERRGDLSTLGIFDHSGTELLYIRFLNPGAVQIRGVFYFAGLPLAKITDTEIEFARNHFSGSCFGSGSIFGFQ